MKLKKSGLCYCYFITTGNIIIADKEGELLHNYTQCKGPNQRIRSYRSTYREKLLEIQFCNISLCGVFCVSVCLCVYVYFWFFISVCLLSMCWCAFVYRFVCLCLFVFDYMCLSICKVGENVQVCVCVCTFCVYECVFLRVCKCMCVYLYLLVQSICVFEIACFCWFVGSD